MQTRKTLMISAAAAAMTAAAPQAQAADAYVSLFGGGSFLEKTGFSGTSRTHTTTTLFFTAKNSVDTSFKTGYVLGGNWGIDWGNFRTELELGLRTNKSSKKAHLKTTYVAHYFSFDGPTAYYTTTVAGETINVPWPGAAQKRDEDVSAKLNLNAYSLMANVWYDFHGLLPYNITPYVGGGVGGALISLSGSLDGIKLNQKTSFVFAWQLGAGLSVPLTEHAKIFVDYRYFRANGAELKFSPALLVGGRVNADYGDHSALVGVRFDL